MEVVTRTYPSVNNMAAIRTLQKWA